MKVGANTLTLMGSNSCTGSTTIAGGTLNVANPSALQNSTVFVANLHFRASFSVADRTN